jgi:hypothetical protein
VFQSSYIVASFRKSLANGVNIRKTTRKEMGEDGIEENEDAVN